jgi:voltage-gated potassium channel
MYEPKKGRKGLIRRWAEQRPFLFLTIALLVIMVCMPLATTKLSHLIFVELNFLLVLGVAVSATGNRRVYIAFALCLWMVSAGLDVIAYFWAVPRFEGWLLVINEISSLAFLLGSTAFLLRFIVKAERVSTNSVFAATSSYLLVALIWAYAYSLLNIIDPQAFNVSQAAEISRVDLVYFSFVTITTLGYGDIAPAAPFARMLAAVESVVGQLYLAVLVAWLVGLTISDRQQKRRQKLEDTKRD